MKEKSLISGGNQEKMLIFAVVLILMCYGRNYKYNRHVYAYIGITE